MERYEIVYHIDSPLGVDGIEARDLADVMYAFAEVVQAAIDESGAEGNLEVKVQPFEKGSFVVEFVLSWGSELVSIFAADEANALANVLAFLGFIGVPSIGAATLPNVIRKVRGHINEYRDNGDGTFTYGRGDGITVNSTAHRIINSPKVAKPFKKVATGPILNFGGSVNITIQESADYRAGNTKAGDTFTDADVADIDMYEHVAVEGVPEEQEDIVSISHNVVLIPVAGPYDGTENGYTFKFDGATYKKVQMHDLEFRLKLERGDVRLMNKDLLVVDMETVQSITKSGKVQTTRAITKVLEYRPYTPPQQITIDDVLSDPECSEDL